MLADRRYFRLWLIGILCGVVRWLELLAFGVYAFDATGSPSFVALIVVLRFLPLSLFGVLMGALSDMFAPERLLTLSIAAILTISVIAYALFTLAEPGYWLIAAASFASGVFWATDLPVRRKLLAAHAPPDRLSGAMALDGATSNGTRFLGPLLGGALYQALGVDGVFAIGAALYFAALMVSLSLSVAAAPRAEANSLRLALSGAGEAWRYARGNRDVMRILLVTVAFNIWGFPYLSMIPVIGRDDLALSASMIGAVTSIEGAASLIGALVLTRAIDPNWRRAIYFGGTLVLLLTIIAIGAFASLPVIAVGLAVGGLSAAGFAVMQSTLIYHVAPAPMRGRFLGLMTICIGAGVIGFVNVGVTAELFGAANALLIIGAEGLIPLLLIAVAWPELRRSLSRAGAD